MLKSDLVTFLMDMLGITETLQKLQIGSQMQSIRDDLNKEDMIFSKESSEDIFNMVNVHSPMPSLFETFPRRNVALSVRKLAATRRAHGEPDQARIRRTCQTVLQSLVKQIRRTPTRTPPLASKHTGKHVMQRKVLENIVNTSRCSKYGRKTNGTERDKQKSMFGLDFLSTVDISYMAPNFQRHLQENMARLRSTDSHYWRQAIKAMLIINILNILKAVNSEIFLIFF